MPTTKTLYSKIADEIEHQIKHELLKIGDRLPSLRAICRSRAVSMNTAIKAYYELEARGLVEAKPQSGYVVSYSHKHFRDLASASQPKLVKGANNAEEVMNQLVDNFKSMDIRLSSAQLEAELVPIKKLNNALLNATQTLENSGVTYNIKGSTRLKTQIARFAGDWGAQLQPDDILPTAGSIDAIAFSLLALTKRGDTIAIESPTYFGTLRLAYSLGLNVIELPTHPINGVDVQALEKLMKTKKIKLCILVTNFSNPLGSCIPAENKKYLAQIAEKYQVPIIEDDVYGELYFGTGRPLNIKSFDESGMVIWCSSFSKTLVSGYRVGWLSAGKFKTEIERVKLYHTLYNSTITHEAIGLFLEKGRYDLHLKKTRNILYGNYLNFQRCISEYFPDDTKVTHPKGGLNLWLEFKPEFDTLDLYNRALTHRISISPGRVYTLQNQYNNCLKLSFGMRWSDEVEKALVTIGKEAKSLY